MITWNIDLSNYTQKQLEDLLFIVEKMDTSIATEISDYLNENFYKYGNILFSDNKKNKLTIEKKLELIITSHCEGATNRVADGVLYKEVAKYIANLLKNGKINERNIMSFDDLNKYSNQA